MGKPLDLQMNLDASKAVQGADDFADAVGDLADAVGDLEDNSRDSERSVSMAFEGMADAAKDAERTTERAFDDMADAADDAGDDMRRDMERALREVARDAKKYGDEGGDDLRRGFKDGTDGIKKEASQVGRESAASFSGEFEDVTDFVRDVLANAFEGSAFGAVAGIAGAAGLGLAVAFFEQWQEEQERRTERIEGWFQDLVESGGKVLDASIISARAAEVIADPSQFEKAQRNAEAWGVSLETAINAMAGSADSISIVNDNMAAQADELAELESRSTNYTDANIKLNGAEVERMRLLQEGRTSLQELNGEMSEATTLANVYSQALLDQVANAKNVTEQVDEYGNILYTLPDGHQIVFDADTGQATEDVDEFKGDVDKIPSEKTTKVKAVMDDSEVRNYNPPTIYIPGRILVAGGRQAI